MNSEKRNNPFKGLLCYDEKDKDIFFGRDNLSRDLFNLVTLNALTLVFGKSGIGKTSLLNAGLFPLLRNVGFLPVRLRMDYSSSGASLIKQVNIRLQTELKKNEVIKRIKGTNEAAPFFSEGETLWEYFHRVDHVDREGKFVIPVLVFDQFEEIFTIGKQHPQGDLLIDELNNLVEDQVPLTVKERLLFRSGVFPYLRSQMAVRVVLGLREDYLPHMNALKPRIPSVHRVMFRVIHLDGMEAREVLDRTGAFSDEAIKKDIMKQFYPPDAELGNVTDDKLEVEPALFSLLCHQVYEKGVGTLTRHIRDDILYRFYEEILGELPCGEELSDWIELHLITEGGFRTPYYLEHDFKLRESVEAAINKRLLRISYIAGKKHVEIIHDILATVICYKRNRRIEEKKRQEIERSLRQKWMNQMTGIILVAFIITIILAIHAYIQKNRAYLQYRVAVSYQTASVAEFILPINNQKAIRIAESAYKIGLPSPPAAVLLALSESAYDIKELHIKIKHNGGVNIAVFSPDGSRILTASDDNTAKLWGLNGNPLVEFKGHTAPIKNAIFSSDGFLILTASDDKTAKLWDIKGNLLMELNGHTRGVNSAVFSPNGSQILTASDDKTAKLWDRKGKLLTELKGHTSGVNSAVFSPNGSQILTTSDDNTVKLWDIMGKPLVTMKSDTSGINKSMCNAFFTTDGRYILNISSEKSTKVWNLKGELLADSYRKEYFPPQLLFYDDSRLIRQEFKDNTIESLSSYALRLAHLQGHKGIIHSIVFSSDSSTFLTASEDKTAKLWDLKGNLLADLKGHTDAVKSGGFSPDGKKIVTASADGSAIIWCTPEGIMDWLKNAPIPKLTPKEKEELGIADFDL